jgi:hypothetical protein
MEGCLIAILTVTLGRYNIIHTYHLQQERPLSTSQSLDFKGLIAKMFAILEL